MVSEDSHDFRWLPKVHRLCDLGDLDQTADREVSPAIHHGDDFGELGEVVSLRRPQWALLKERDDNIPQISESLHAVTEDVLPVIVMPAIAEHLPASEEADKAFQNVAA